jgi:hemoglobin
MAFGGPYRYEGRELRDAHRRLVQELGMTDAHVDRVIAHFRDSVTELHLPDAEVQKMCEILETFRDDVLDR